MPSDRLMIFGCIVSLTSDYPWVWIHGTLQQYEILFISKKEAIYVKYVKTKYREQKHLNDWLHLLVSLMVVNFFVTSSFKLCGQYVCTFKTVFKQLAFMPLSAVWLMIFLLIFTLNGPHACELRKMCYGYYNCRELL